MADQAPSEAAQVNGAPAEAPAAPAIDDRAQFLADMAAAKASQPAAPAPEAPTLAGVSSSATQEKGAGAATATEDDEIDLDEPTEAAPYEDPDADLDDEDDDAALAKQAKADPELAKRLRVVEKHDQRRRAAFDRERQDFERQKASWTEQTKPIADAAKRFEQLGERLRGGDIMAVLEEHKVPPAMLEVIARTVFANTEIGKSDPKNAQFAAQLRAKQAENAALAEANARIKKLEDERAAEVANAAVERDMYAYLDRTEKLSSNPKLPLMAKALAADPGTTRRELAGIAHQLWQTSGERPTEKAVAIAYEKQCRAIARRLGLDPKAAVAAKNAAPVPDAKADKKAPAKKPATQPAPPKADDHPEERNGRARDPDRDQFLADMAKMRAEAAASGN